MEIKPDYALCKALSNLSTANARIETQKAETTRLNKVIQLQSRRLKEAECEPGALPSAMRAELIRRAEKAEADLERVREWSKKMREYDWQPGLLQMAYIQIADELDAILSPTKLNHD